MKSFLASRPVLATTSAVVLAAAFASIALQLVALSTVVGSVAAVGVLGFAMLDYSGQLRPRAFDTRSSSPRTSATAESSAAALATLSLSTAPAA